VRGRGILIALFVLTLPLVTPKIRGADEIEYFSYLRSLVFDHDLEFGDEYQHFYDQDRSGLAGFKTTFLDLREPQTGRHINFAPLGAGLLWAPFFLLAHGGVLLLRAVGGGVAADGYSKPYVAAVCYASALYGFGGLLLTHAALRRWGGVTDLQATVSVVALWFGTPLFYYMTIAPGFSHATSVFTIGALVYLSLRVAERGSYGLGEAALLGAAGGLAALVREQDLLYLVIPGLLFAAHAGARREVVRPVLALLTMGATAVLTFVPQLLAYHGVNGAWGPSKMVTRKMTWTSPHFFAVLLDPGHGLLIWTPLLLLAIAGLLLALGAKRRAWAWGLLLAFGLQVWINGCLESWTQAGAFGSRRFVSATPVLAFGLATLVVFAGRHRMRMGTVLALTVSVWWNLSLMVQFGLRLMDRQGMTWPRVAISAAAVRGPDR